MKLDQHTKLFGIVGCPIGHSMSPVMHNAAFAATEMNAVYLAFETRSLSGSLDAMRALGLQGMSITLPYKAEAIPLLDGVDPPAARIGAVNTVVNRGGRLRGYNTDGIGALRALEEVTGLPGKTCLIVGAGGAARAIGFALRMNGVKFRITNRSRDRGEALARSLDCPYVPMERIRGQEADLLIQTTPVGMHPDVDRSPVPEDMISRHMTVMDIVYNPVETMLLKAARRRGCTVIGGLRMLIHQGAAQFKLWTGVEAPVAAMTRAVEQALEVETSKVDGLVNAYDHHFGHPHA